jgi:hypothetical protein
VEKGEKKDERKERREGETEEMGGAPLKPKFLF